VYEQKELDRLRQEQIREPLEIALAEVVVLKGMLYVLY
jgi:hypothetical protein